jgi:hypothetical protein
MVCKRLDTDRILLGACNQYFNIFFHMLREHKIKSHKKITKQKGENLMAKKKEVKKDTKEKKAIRKSKLKIQLN